MSNVAWMAFWLHSAPLPTCASEYSGFLVAVYSTTNVPVIVVGCTSHLKKYSPTLVGAVKVYVAVPGPVTNLPVNSVVFAVESVYREKLCIIPESLLVKLIVTLAPGGTTIVLVSKARFWAVSVTVTGAPDAVVPLGDLDVVVGAGPDEHDSIASARTTSVATHAAARSRYLGEFLMAVLTLPANVASGPVTVEPFHVRYSSRVMLEPSTGIGCEPRIFE